MYYFKQQNQKKKQSAWPYLYQFLQGVAGAGNEVRSKWVFDNIELSQVSPYTYVCDYKYPPNAMTSLS